MSIDYTSPENYIGSFQNCYTSYSNDASIREGAASGGVVSTLLIYLLEKGYVDGVFVSRQHVRNGRIEVESFVTRRKEDVLDCQTSIYTFFPLEKNFDKIIEFKGSVGVVLLPCHIRMLNMLSRQKPELKNKIKYKIALFCGGVANDTLMYKLLAKNGVDINDVNRIYSRKGHWRGRTVINMKDGNEKTISYTKNWSSYKNAFFYSTVKCFSCSDHFGYDADFCCGDIWLQEMKKKDIKNSAIITKNEGADKIFNEMLENKLITASQVGADFILRGNKRAIIYKYHTAEARARLGKVFGLKYSGQSIYKSRWNHYIAAFFILLNMRLSKDNNKMDLILRLPKGLVYCYMVFIRIFISF